MFPKHFLLIIWIVVSLQLKDTASFFVKQFVFRYSTGFCIKDTGHIQSSGSWGNLSFLERSYDCLDPAAQFRFRDNGAMLNLKRQGCLAAFNKSGSGYDLAMFYLYVDSVSLDTAACAQKPNEGIYRAITQTPDGALSVYYKGKDKSLFENWCAVTIDRFYTRFHKKYGYDRFGYDLIGLTTKCHSNYFDRIFIFGSVTCYGDMVRNANCPKDQYMVVKFASYRGLLAPKTCGSSDHGYSCEVDVLCTVKQRCDGLHECNITVDDNLFSGDLCPGLSKYLYFLYQCIDTVKPHKEPCVDDVFLSYSPLPYKGIVQITINGRIKNVCWGSLKNGVKNIVCSYMGYYRAYSRVMSAPTDAKEAIFYGTINCNGGAKYLSQCSVTASASQSCSGLSYIECSGVSRYKPLLEDNQRFPDSSFSASASSEGHSAFDARISSGGSWCAPVSVDKHYLQLDLGKVYRVYYLITYGDSTSPKWVAKYKLNYTIDLVKWNYYRSYEGNKNAYDHAAREYLRLRARALRFIPLTYVGQPCVRIDIWGENLINDKLTNLTVANITSGSAEISWLDPKNYGRYGLSRFKIKLKKNSVIIRSFTAREMNEYEIDSLTPHTTYEISVAAGNHKGYSEGTITTFLTSEEAPSGPPLNVKTNSRSTSSLSFIWDPPPKTKQNGVIINYTACVSHSQNGSCFQKFVTSEREWLVGNLNASTKYYVRVLASTKVGHGQYSTSKGYFTNGFPSGPPLNIKAISRSASSSFFIWDPPEKAKQNGVIVSYTACISHSENGPCFQTFITSKRQWLVGNFNASTNYYVRVFASTKAGPGNFSESKRFFTNGRAVEKPIAATLSTLTLSLENPSTKFSYFYVVALKLKDGKEAALSDSYENNEFVTYAEAKHSTDLKPYIAAVVTSSGVDGNIFILGDGRNTNDPTSRKLGSTTSDYFNGPLEPGTGYRIFQRIVINEKSDYYSTDWSPASKTSEYPGTDKNNYGSEKNLAGIVVLAILLVISFVSNAYLVYQIRRLKSSSSKSTKTNVERTNGGNNSRDIHYNRDSDDVSIYEQVENEQSTYTALKRPGERESDVHLYCHLNEVQYQKETGI